jgi:CRISPR-associated protein Cmr6
MPYSPYSTLGALGGATLLNLDSRALRLTRFAEPSLKEEARKQFFADAFAKRPVSAESVRPLERWLNWLQQLQRDQSQPVHLLFGRLNTRMALHLSGGVMENANIQLDRFGYPWIPGSGIKGLARRAALHALRVWSVEFGGTKPIAAGEPASEICREFDTPDELALATLRTFGWADAEWADARNRRGALRSDIEWALGEGQSWIEARRRLAILLRERHGIKLASRADRPAGAFAAAVCFLDAKPISHAYPSAPHDLELDVVTSHHSKYYRGELPAGLDTEPPVPVYFPTVAPGITFVFASRGAHLALFARSCMKVALTTFGAGAKTAAGYGWFEDVTQQVLQRMAAAEEEKRRLAAEEVATAKRAAELEQRKRREARLAALTPSGRADEELAEMANDWGRMKQHLSKFAKLTPEQQVAIVCWLNAAGRDRWLNEIKLEASKGRKPWSQIIGDIHRVKNIHKLALP